MLDLKDLWSLFRNELSDYKTIYLKSFDKFLYDTSVAVFSKVFTFSITWKAIKYAFEILDKYIEQFIASYDLPLQLHVT